MSHDSARTNDCNGCDKLRGFLLNSLALVSFRRARKGVGRTQSACARHLEVTTGRADGGSAPRAYCSTSQRCSFSPRKLSYILQLRCTIHGNTYVSLRCIASGSNAALSHSYTGPAHPHLIERTPISIGPQTRMRLCPPSDLQALRQQQRRRSGHRRAQRVPEQMLRHAAPSPRARGDQGHGAQARRGRR